MDSVNRLPSIYSTPITHIARNRQVISFTFPFEVGLTWKQFRYTWTGLSSCEACIFCKGKNGLLHQLHHYLLYTPREYHNFEYMIPSFPDNHDDAKIIISIRLPFYHEGGSLRISFIGYRDMYPSTGYFMLTDYKQLPKWLIAIHKNNAHNSYSISLQCAFHRSILENDIVIPYNGLIRSYVSSLDTDFEGSYEAGDERVDERVDDAETESFSSSPKETITNSAFLSSQPPLSINIRPDRSYNWHI